MASSVMFNVTEPIQEDNGRQRYEVHGYQPDQGTSINNTGEIRINVTTKDTIIYPHESYLLIEGRLTKESGNESYSNGDSVALANNGLMYLFSKY
jgi:hypothetical protein